MSQPDPIVSVMRSRQYVALLAFAGRRSGWWSRSPRTSSSRCQQGAEVGLHRPAEGASAINSTPTWWPLPVLFVAGRHRRARDRLPARHRWRVADPWVQAWRRPHARAAARDPARRARVDLPRCGDRTGDAACRARLGTRRARGQAGQARRAAAVGDGACGGRQLRRDQRAARFAAARRVPAARGGRTHRCHPRSGPGPRAVGRRSRLAGVSRPQRLDRAGHLFPRAAGPSADRPPDARAVRLGDRDRQWPPQCSAPRSGGSRWSSRRTSSAAYSC